MKSNSSDVPFFNATGLLKRLVDRARITDYAEHSGGVLESNFKKWSSRTFGDKTRLDHIPGVLQHSPVFGEYKVKVFEQLRESANSLTFSSAGQALVSWSTPTSHLAGPVEDVERSRKGAGLQNPSSEYLAILRELVKRCVARGEYGTIHLRAKSHCGAPSFTVGKNAKHFILGRTLSNLTDILRLVTEGKYEELMLKYDIFAVYSSGVRIQADNVKFNDQGELEVKKRPCFTKEAYISQDFSESNITFMDYRVDPGVFGRNSDKLLAARSRMMFSLSYGINCILQIMQNYLYHGFTSFCECVNYAGPDDVVRRIRSFLGNTGEPEPNEIELSDKIVSLDKSQFDTTMSPEALECMCDELENQSFFGSFVRETLELPVLINMLEKGVKSAIVSRADYATDLFTSFKSGHGLVAFIGKLLGMTDALMELKVLLKDRFDLERILTQTHPDVLLFNSGDDTMYVFRTAEMCRAFKQQKRVGVHKDELEEKPIFLGYYYTEFVWFKDLKKLVEIFTGNERGSYGKVNQMLGFGAAITEYRRCKELEKVLNVIFRVYRDINGVDIEKQVVPFMDRSYSTADTTFLSNPEAIFYKLDPNDVSEDLMLEEFEFVKPEFFVEIFERSRKEYYGETNK